MKLKFVVFLFVLFSALLIVTALNDTLKPLRSEYNKLVRLENIQHVSKKKEKRERKRYVPKYTIEQASKKIIFILRKTPINIEVKAYSALTKSTLVKIVAIINKLEERVVLMIEVERYKNVSAPINLKASQMCADRLKAYFLEKTNLLFVTAIGYGSALASKEHNAKQGSDCYVKMRLKRVK